MSTIKEIVRKLRKSQTAAEKKLWKSLKAKQLGGYKFLRQHPIIYEQNFNGKILFFVADFYCAEKRLVIELDGKIHDFQKEYDENRQAVLESMNMKVLRFRNEELDNHFEDVLKRILNA